MSRMFTLILISLLLVACAESPPITIVNQESAISETQATIATQPTITREPLIVIANPGEYGYAHLQTRIFNGSDNPNNEQTWVTPVTTGKLDITDATDPWGVVTFTSASGKSGTLDTATGVWVIDGIAYPASTTTPEPSPTLIPQATPTGSPTPTPDPKSTAIHNFGMPYRIAGTGILYDGGNWHNAWFEMNNLWRSDLGDTLVYVHTGYVQKPDDNSMVVDTPETPAQGVVAVAIYRDQIEYDLLAEILFYSTTNIGGIRIRDVSGTTFDLVSSTGVKAQFDLETLTFSPDLFVLLDRNNPEEITTALPLLNPTPTLTR